MCPTLNSSLKRPPHFICFPCRKCVRQNATLPGKPSRNEKLPGSLVSPSFPVEVDCCQPAVCQVQLHRDSHTNSVGIHPFPPEWGKGPDPFRLWEEPRIQVFSPGSLCREHVLQTTQKYPKHDSSRFFFLDRCPSFLHFGQGLFMGMAPPSLNAG